MRQDYIDRAKGLAIILVVLGHVVAREIPVGAEWYAVLKDRIYVFHMPLFMWLSGMALGFGLKAPQSWSDYVSTLNKRVGRLVGGYLLLGVTIFAGKLAFQQFTVVDNPVRGPEALLDLVLKPAASFSSFLWYVYVLSIFYALMPWLFKLSRGRLLPWLLLAAVLPLLPSSVLLAWNKMQELAIFFIAGLIAARHHADFERSLDKVGGFALFGFAAVLPWVPKGTLWAALCCVLGVWGLLWVLRQPLATRSGWLSRVGAYTLSIYLLNTVVIGVLKALWVKSIGWEGIRFIPAFFVLGLGGVLVPIIAKRWMFSRIRWLDRLT